MLTAVASGFFLAVLAPFLAARLRQAAGWVLAVYPIAVTAFFANAIAPIRSGTAVAESYRWAPSLGLNLSFRLDGLSLVLGLLISGIGTLVVIYTGGYLKGHPHQGRFFAFLLAFMASMLGVVLADNLLVLFLFWELTSFSSYFLIGFEHESETARRSALQALLVTSGGGLSLLAGLILLGIAGGSFEISELLTRRDVLEQDPRWLWALGLLLIGAFTKSAQVPFHFWLPNAMAAPTPASAYLHSSTMVKAGVYLLARMQVLFVGTALWDFSVTTVGAITMVIGAFLAVRETYYKRLLAYTTMSILGLLTMLLGIGGTLAAEAAMVYLIAHALYKAALFLVAGAVDHETGARDVKMLGGLARNMPLIATAAVLSGLSMAGVIGTFGFVAKELLFEAALDAEGAFLLVACSFIGSLLMVTVAGLVGWQPFFGARPNYSRTPTNGGVSLWLGPLLLSLGGLAVGLWPGILDQGIISPAVSAVLGESAEVHLKVWHGINAALVLELLSLAGGVALFLSIHPVRQRLNTLSAIDRYGPDRGYDLALSGMLRFAGLQTRFLQSGYLRLYLVTIVLTVLILVGGVLVFSRSLPPEIFTFNELKIHEAGMAVVILAAVGMVLFSSNRLAAIAALGVVGYGVGILFVMFGAPDLAVTQFLVETLTVILFVLVFYRFHEYKPVSTPRQRIRDLAICGSAGALMAVLVLLSNSTHWLPSISEYYRENSAELAHGRNIVNVILVDFRGIDTLGEITVLSIAAMGVYSLLKLRLKRPEDTP